MAVPSDITNGPLTSHTRKGFNVSYIIIMQSKKGVNISNCSNNYSNRHYNQLRLIVGC